MLTELYCSFYEKTILKNFLNCRETMCIFRSERWDNEYPKIIKVLILESGNLMLGCGITVYSAGRVNAEF